LKAGDIKAALQTSTNIKNDFEKANSLQAIAAAQVKAGDEAGSMLTFRQAVQIVNSAWDPRQKPRTLEAIAKTQAEVGDVQGAIETVNSTKDAYEKSIILQIVGIAQAKAGDRAGAGQTFQQALLITKSIYQAA